MINKHCLIQNTQEVSGCPINYVLRNAHLCINSGANFSQIILSLHLYKNYYDYKNIYINNMAKRQANGATNSLDKKFEIDTDTFVVVTNFNGHLLVHIRKYNNNFPSKEGVCMFINK